MHAMNQSISCLQCLTSICNFWSGALAVVPPRLGRVSTCLAAMASAVVRSARRAPIVGSYWEACHSCATRMTQQLCVNTRHDPGQMRMSWSVHVQALQHNTAAGPVPVSTFLSRAHVCHIAHSVVDWLGHDALAGALSCCLEIDMTVWAVNRRRVAQIPKQSIRQEAWCPSMLRTMK